jgi:hypothetical protein
MNANKWYTTLQYQVALSLWQVRSKTWATMMPGYIVAWEHIKEHPIPETDFSYHASLL